MNEEYLLNHISRQLLTPIQIFNSNRELLQHFSSIAGFVDPVLDMPSVKDYIFSCADTALPTLIRINQNLFYGIVTVDNTDWTDTARYLIGPVHISEPLYPKYHMENIAFDEKWVQTLSVCSVDQFLSHILLLDNMLHNPGCSREDLVAKNFDSERLRNEVEQHYAEQIFKNQEFGEHHNPYDQEIRENLSIEQGDVEQLKKSISEAYTGKLGTLSKNHLRNLKNLGIVVITLVSRAAIRGGLSPEVSFSLSDSYIQKLEDVKDEPSMLYLTRQAEYHYAELVHDLKERQEKRHRTDQHPRVEHCKNYIFAHLHEKILISDIADELHINCNYLSDIFRQYEGISIAQYIRKEKINLAKNLLVYSQYSYIEIASYLGFSSQSHLGAQFRQVTGYTLRQFREKYSVQKDQ